MLRINTSQLIQVYTYRLFPMSRQNFSLKAKYKIREIRLFFNTSTMLKSISKKKNHRRCPQMSCNQIMTNSYCS
jgi:hypothetical protein